MQNKDPNQTLKTVLCTSGRKAENTNSTCDHRILTTLNGIVFQYLDISGLDETYKTLYDECTSVGSPIPQNWSPEISTSTICPNDIEKLFNYFDDEIGHGLINQWDYLMQKLDASSCSETKKLNIFLHIHVSLIPYRKNQSNEVKTNSMRELKKYFELKPDDCTNDEEVLSYFALPYVQDPKNHLVFSKLLTNKWIERLRNRLVNCLSKLTSSKHTAVNPMESDLAQLFLGWMTGANHSITLTNGETWSLHTTSHKVKLSSESSYKTNGPIRDSPLYKYFIAIDEILEKNKRLERSERCALKKYSEKTKLCNLLLEALCDSCNGRNVDMDQLQETICQFVPDLFDSSSIEANRKPKSPNNKNHSSIKYCSRKNNDRDEDDNSTLNLKHSFQSSNLEHSNIDTKEKEPRSSRKSYNNLNSSRSLNAEENDNAKYENYATQGFCNYEAPESFRHFDGTGDPDLEDFEDDIDDDPDEYPDIPDDQFEYPSIPNNEESNTQRTYRLDEETLANNADTSLSQRGETFNDTSQENLHESSNLSTEDLQNVFDNSESRVKHLKQLEEKVNEMNQVSWKSMFHVADKIGIKSKTIISDQTGIPVNDNKALSERIDISQKEFRRSQSEILLSKR